MPIDGLGEHERPSRRLAAAPSWSRLGPHRNSAEDARATSGRREATRPTRREIDQDNPLFRWRDAPVDQPDRAIRDEAVRDYAFTIPNEPALSAIGVASPHGVVEVGAGTGYWARLLADRGVEVIASDIAPAPNNKWFSGSAAWFDIVVSDHHIAAAHEERSLLMVWPTFNEDWPGDCLSLSADAGGDTLLYVGEPPGGRTGDDRFHALLGEYDRCWACALGVRSLACICGIAARFSRSSQVSLPHWTRCRDDLFIYCRTVPGPGLGPEPFGRRGPRRWPSSRTGQDRLRGQGVGSPGRR